MRIHWQSALAPLLGLALTLTALPATAQVKITCPGDLNDDAVPDPTCFGGLCGPGNNGRPNPAFRPEVKCLHLGAGDGFARMGDGTMLYTFGFSDLVGVHADHAMMRGMLAAEWPAPTIAVDEGDQVYLTLTNVGMMMRPDLFDPHSVHWHGFPQAAPIFDGMPESTVTVNMGASQPYFYKVIEPGTYMYHCHVEATEHMQMGMLGNLYVRPAQNKRPDNTDLRGFVHRSGYKYVYDDGDGSTYYDVELPLQIGAMDSYYHMEHEAVQPLPFAAMADDYGMLNGRGYPDTLRLNPLAAPTENGGIPSQKVTSFIRATIGQKVLLRISSLAVTRFFTLATTGLPLKIVGADARLLRGPSPDGGTTPGRDLSYTTGSVTLGGGESVDAIIDTTGMPAGRYFIYTTNLNYLSNGSEDFGGLGGMVTEIQLD